MFIGRSGWKKGVTASSSSQPNRINNISKSSGWQALSDALKATWTGIPLHGDSVISIRSPLARRDPRQIYPCMAMALISILSSLAGRDASCSPCQSSPADFNPLAPYGARRCFSLQGTVMLYFNPLAHCGARLTLCLSSGSAIIFQSTRPLRGETAKSHKILLAKTIPFAQLISLQIRKLGLLRRKMSCA